MRGRWVTYELVFFLSRCSNGSYSSSFSLYSPITTPAILVLLLNSCIGLSIAACCFVFFPMASVHPRQIELKAAFLLYVESLRLKLSRECGGLDVSASCSHPRSIFQGSSFLPVAFLATIRNCAYLYHASTVASPQIMTLSTDPGAASASVMRYD